MTRHAVTVLEDGTRVYSNHTRYTPKPEHLRKNGHRKPQEPGCVLFQSIWWHPLALRPDGDRRWPETRSDEEAYEHMLRPRKCVCRVCKRPASERWKQKWLKDRGLRF